MHFLGLDIVEIARIEKALARWGERFLHRVYTERELELYRDRVPELAARFAAKEAVMKALGTGNRGVAWREIEVLRNQRGAPQVYLHGRASLQAHRLGMKELAISLTHSREYALASVIGERNEAGNH